MGYRRQQYSDDAWSTFRRKLDSIDSTISQLDYDPYLNKNNGFNRLNFGESDLENPEKFGFLYKLFLLPKELSFEPVNICLKPIPLPEYPSIPEIPESSIIKSATQAISKQKETSTLGILFDGLRKKFISDDNSKSVHTNEVASPNLVEEAKFTAEETALINRAKYCDKKIKEIKAKHKEIFKKSENDLNSFLNSIDPKQNEEVIKLVHHKYALDETLSKNFNVNVNPELKIALVEFEFPDFANRPLVMEYKSNYPHLPKLATETNKKKIIKSCLYSLIIRAAYIAAKYKQGDLYTLVVVNVHQNWFDSATGQPKSGFIASVQAPVEYLLNLNLEKLDPESCFKHLKGILTPSLESQNPIRPIFVMNKDDERFVDSKPVDGDLDEGTNLAAMDWEDFEHLVAQLFEWEFKKNNVEVKVTRASRDRGVDAILFDPDPLKGGKYVLQAKRYTRIVDVSAVRDLYGTVMNEGANRGILITTSSYGPDAYEFAKDKPISLVDGQHLVQMLQKHGKNYKVDIEEARRLNVEN